MTTEEGRLVNYIAQKIENTKVVLLEGGKDCPHCEYWRGQLSIQRPVFHCAMCGKVL